MTKIKTNLAKINPSKITLVDYEKILSEIKDQISQTQSGIIKTITRQKVVMAWNVGKIIDQHLLRNTKTGYGEKLIEQLAQDTSIIDKTLYKMRSFYHSYPKLPKDDDQLNWTHYQMLSGVKKDDERKRLEILAKDNDWSTDNLQKEVTKLKTKNGKGKFAKEFSEKATAKKLYSERGQLYSYPILKFAETEKTYLDLGFNIFKEIEETLPQAVSQADAVEVSKKNEKYSLSKSTIHPRKNISFLIIKTIKIDIYGRYVADIFFSENNQESDPQKIADGGIYLNQLLLDEGLVKKLTISS